MEDVRQYIVCHPSAPHEPEGVVRAGNTARYVTYLQDGAKVVTWVFMTWEN